MSTITATYCHVCDAIASFFLEQRLDHSLIGPK